MDNDEIRKRLAALKVKFAAFKERYRHRLYLMTERRRSKRLNALAMRRRRSR
jgi:hypothetical protein